MVVWLVYFDWFFDSLRWRPRSIENLWKLELATIEMSYPTVGSVLSQIRASLTEVRKLEEQKPLKNLTFYIYYFKFYAVEPNPKNLGNQTFFKHNLQI
jgi:hypothetical protein